MIKPKTKKVKKWKYSRREGLERLGFLFNMKGEYNAPNEVNGEDVYKIFMATQPQPIKEEWNKNVETCSNCGIQWKKIGKQCPVCYEPAEEHTCSNCINQGNEGDDICCYCGENRSNFVKQEEPKQQSKDIEPFKTLFTYSRNYPDLCATQTPEFKKWVKQVTDTINSLTKRNKK